MIAACTLPYFLHCHTVLHVHFTLEAVLHGVECSDRYRCGAREHSLHVAEVVRIELWAREGEVENGRDNMQVSDLEKKIRSKIEKHS